MLTSLSRLLYTSWVVCEIFERMEIENLEVVLLCPSEINRKKQDKELKIGTDDFDVKYAVQESDKIEFHGLFHKKEKAIEKNLNSSLSENQNNNNINSVFQFRQKNYLLKLNLINGRFIATLKLTCILNSLKTSITQSFRIWFFRPIMNTFVVERPPSFYAI